MAARKNDVTADEVIAILKRSGLPTILVEGSDDMIVYRTFEEKLARLGVSVLPVGGREKVLEIFCRRSELTSTPCPFFIADKDLWVVSGVPSHYIDGCMLFTHGYSIENDVYVDGELRSLLRGAECAAYAAELSDFIEWYALALNRRFTNPAHPIALHPDQVLNPVERPALLTLDQNENYPLSLRDSIAQNYQFAIRGKSLLNLLIRNTNYKGRDPQHKKNALLEMVAIRPGVLLNSMYQRVEQYFEPSTGVI